jgi:chemotaxis signal transduction protein
MRGLSFHACGELYLTDVSNVHKVIRGVTVTPVPASLPVVVGIANLKGKVITLLDLTVLLERRPPTARTAHGQTVHAVVFKAEGHNDDQMGLLIDRPGTLIDIDDHAVEPPPAALSETANGILTGIAEVNGVLYRIIDKNGITRQFMRQSGASEPYGEAQT